ncbi:MAG: sugar ABC transporter permease [Clostridiales bacterium]|nr:sugar ABC transporter permease [Clostridiales bacterium]
MTLRSRRTIGIIVLVLAMLFSVFACGSSSINGSINTNGNVDAEIYVTKQKVEPYGVTSLDEFKTFFGKYVEFLNGKSDDIDVLKVNGYAQTEDGYKVNIHTRRINRIGGLGSLEFREASVYAKFKDMDQIKDYYSRIREKIVRVNYPNGSGETSTYTIRDTSKRIFAKTQVNGEWQKVEYEDFYKYLSASKDRIIVCKIATPIFIDSISLRVNGKIKYVSSQGMEVTDKNEVKLSATTYSSDKGDITALIGYFTYSEGISGFAIGCICVGGGLIIGLLIFLAIKFKWFKKPQKQEAEDIPNDKEFVLQEDKGKKNKLWEKVKKYKALYFMLIPGFALLILFHYLPLAGLTTAFQRYDTFDGYGSEFIGLKNFSNIFFATTSDKMYRIFRNTIFISLIRIVTNFPIILLLALVVQSIKNKHVKGIFQGISFIPYFISWTAVGGMAYGILQYDSGILNTVLKQIGLEPVLWYSTSSHWWAILAITSLWKGMGWGTLIYIAAMCNIDAELYEACALDGGGALRQAFSVTLPSIMTVVCLQLILDTGSIMKDNYEQIIALVPGDTTQLNDTIEVIGKYTFSQLDGDGMGSATAMGLIQSVIGLILVLFANSIVKKTDNEGIL